MGRLLTARIGGLSTLRPRQTGLHTHGGSEPQAGHPPSNGIWDERRFARRESCTGLGDGSQRGAVLVPGNHAIRKDHPRVIMTPTCKEQHDEET
jgi:hypothetical protein